MQKSSLWCSLSGIVLMLPVKTTQYHLFPFSYCPEICWFHTETVKLWEKPPAVHSWCCQELWVSKMAARGHVTSPETCTYSTGSPDQCFYCTAIINEQEEAWGINNEWTYRQTERGEKTPGITHTTSHTQLIFSQTCIQSVAPCWSLEEGTSA